MRLVKFTLDNTEAVWINPEMVTRVEATQTRASTTIYLRGDGYVQVRESVQVVVEALANIVRI